MREKIQALFEKTALGLWETISRKAALYGWSRFDSHSEQFDYWMCFSDVHRKTLRLEQLTVGALSLPPDEFNDRCKAKLLDDYKDIANYAIMAIIILEDRYGV
jgi:hypothetical protein